MILTTDAAERFRALFGGLLEYVGSQMVLIAPDTVRDLKREGADLFNVSMMHTVWGEMGDLLLIDDYVSACGDILSDSDVREIMSWKNGTFELFMVHRVGDDVVFVYGDHAFVVCGIDREVDWDIEPPTYVQTLIVPFDGLITYGMAKLNLPIDISEDHMSFYLDELRSCLDAGRVARTADGYARLIGAARKSDTEERAEHERWKEEVCAEADELMEGQYRSELADVGWDERVAALRELDQELADETARSFMEQGVTPGPATTSLLECVMRLTKPEICELARFEGVGGSLSKMRKAELAKALVDSVEPDPYEILERLVVVGGCADLENLRDLIRAGGRLDSPASGFASPDDVPLPSHPEKWLFRNDTGYTLVIPDKFLDAFLALPDDVLLTYIERGRKLDAITARIAVLTELRGVVFDHEVMPDILDIVDGDDLSYFVEALVRRMEYGTLTYVLTELEGHRGNIFALREVCEDMGGVFEIFDPSFVETILRRRQKYPARDCREFSGRRDFIDWVQTHASYRALVAFLDGCVPEGEDDRIWAVSQADGIASAVRVALGPIDELALVSANDLYLSQAQHERVADLIGALLDDIPRWVYNGWSQSELQHMVRR